MTINAPPPLRGGRYYSGRTKLIIGFAAFLALAAIYELGVYISKPAAPVVTHEEPHNRGLGFPSLPPPRRESLGDRIKKTVEQRPSATVPQLIDDPALVSGTEMANGDTGGSDAAETAPGGPYATSGPGGAKARAKGDGDDDLARAVRPSDLGPPSRAWVDRDADYEISAGRHIPCQTDVATNSELPGTITCVIREPVKNDDGTALLLPAGTHVFGQIRGGITGLNDRLLVLWTRIRTSDDPPIKIDIHSEAADMIGANGMPVSVNDHFWQALLATAVFSFVDYGPQLVNSLIQRNNQSPTFNFTQSFTPQQGLANTVLNRYINQPPTGEANQGAWLTINVNADIDCSGAVEFRMRGSAE